MPARALDTLLALKVLSLVEGLNANSRRVAATLIEHYNRRTTRCDPGLETIARLLGISARTVIRAIDRIVAAGLFVRIRHGGPGNRNRYEPNWERFAQLEATWQQRRKFRRQWSELSPSPRQECHLGGDSPVSQTCTTKNITSETYFKRSSELEIRKNPFRSFRMPKVSPKPSAEAARNEAERRWTTAIHRMFGDTEIAYAKIIEAVDEAIKVEATDAELRRRGAGVGVVINRLQLGGTRG